MTQAAVLDSMSKFQRYRQKQVQQGMKLLRMWIPDPHTPGFTEEAKRQAALLRGAREELEALDFIETEGAWE